MNRRTALKAIAALPMVVKGIAPASKYPLYETGITTSDVLYGCVGFKLDNVSEPREAFAEVPGATAIVKKGKRVLVVRLREGHIWKLAACEV